MLDKDPHGLKALAMSQLIPKIRGAFDLQSKRKESSSINITTNIETAALSWMEWDGLDGCDGYHRS